MYHDPLGCKHPHNQPPPSLSLNLHFYQIHQNLGIITRHQTHRFHQDLRCKEDVQTLPYGLREVLKIEPICYKWKASDNRDIHLGFSAQNVETIIPEIVIQADPVKSDVSQEKRSKSTADIKGMKYAEMIPVLVKAIQEQHAIIQNLEARIKTLESN